MTFVGKTLVVLHLILSVMFMAFAGAVFSTQKNWMANSQRLKKDLDESKQSLQTRTVDFENQKKDLEAQITKLDNLSKQLQGDLENAQATAKRLTDDNQALKTSLDTERDLALRNTTEADERNKEAVLQKDKNSQLYKTREELFLENRKLQDELFALRVERDQLLDKHQLTLADFAVLQTFLKAKGYATDPKQLTLNSSPPPDVEGVVLEYRKEDKSREELVEISIGSDSGLAKGHTLTVFTENKYLGRIKLINVSPDRAVGRLVEKAPNSTIQKGNYVSTKL